VLKKKSFLLGVILLALPNMLQNLVTNLASLIDNLMVGSLQEHAIAGVTVTNQVVFIFTIVLFGIGGAAGIFIPQFKGIGNEAKMTEVFKISLIFSMILSIIFFFAMLIFPENVLRIFAQNPYDIAAAMDYLRFIKYTFLILPISLAIGNAYRLSGFVKIPMYLAFITVGINTVLNIGLINGNFGLPAMGVEGAALGTLLSRILEFIIYILLTKIIKSPVKIKILTLFTIEKSLFRAFIQKGYGLVLNEFFWAFGVQALTVIYTMRLSENIAAMSIAQTFGKLVWVGMGGISVVFSIYLGDHLGRSEFNEAKTVARKLKIISSFTGITLGLIVFAISFFLIGLFNVEPHILRTGQIILAITVGFSWINYLNSSYFFILRAGGDTKGVLIIDSFYTWLITLPAAFLIGQLPIVMALHFFIMQFSEIGKLIVAHRLYKKGTWLKNLTTI